ncbi:DUF4397 domain-containing protein [Halorientalis salina]|uniref:DUF4397 domain-containing protein n=1 Tax=Halorientalis salina TaxID=2932266 RepID=UPI00145F6567|nr:DUF4397 domain-containing protein [Halorientalis salina]
MSGSTNRGLTRVQLVALTLVAVAIAGVAVVGGAAAVPQETPQNETQPQDGGQGQGQAEAQVRLVHASPDAPGVDIYVDGEPAVEDLMFGNETDYVSLQPGMHNVTITEAGNASNVVFQQDIPVRPGQFTIAASGEISPDAEREFAPVLLVDDAQPGDDESMVRLAHLSPDAPTVDVTVAESGDVLFDNVSFANATDYETVPPGDYTLEVRAATPEGDGEVVQEVNVTTEGGQAYTAIAAGYLDPEEAPGDEEFRVLLLEDETAEQPGNGGMTPPEQPGNQTGGPGSPAP